MEKYENDWRFVPTEHTWELYKNGNLFFTFGLGNDEFTPKTLIHFIGYEPYDVDVQAILDTVLGMILEMEMELELPEDWLRTEEEKEENIEDEEERYHLVDIMFSALRNHFNIH